MQCVRIGCGEYHFRIAGHVNGAASPCAVGDAHPAQLDCVFGRHHDFGMGIDVLIVATKFRAALGENGFVRFCTFERRLMGVGPKCAANLITDVAERTPVVAGRVFTPAGDGQVFPAAIARTGIGQHHVIKAIR